MGQLHTAHRQRSTGQPLHSLHPRQCAGRLRLRCFAQPPAEPGGKRRIGVAHSTKIEHLFCAGKILQPGLQQRPGDGIAAHQKLAVLLQRLHCGGGKGLFPFPVQRRGKACPQQLHCPAQLLFGAALQRHQCFRAPGAAAHRPLPSIRQSCHSLLHGLLRCTEQPQHAARRAVFFL